MGISNSPNESVSAYCSLKRHTYLNKSTAKSCRFVYVCGYFGGKYALKINGVKKQQNLKGCFQISLLVLGESERIKLKLA